MRISKAEKRLNSSEEVLASEDWAVEIQIKECLQILTENFKTGKKLVKCVMWQNWQNYVIM